MDTIFLRRRRIVSRDPSDDIFIPSVSMRTPVTNLPDCIRIIDLIRNGRDVYYYLPPLYGFLDRCASRALLKEKFIS